MGSITYEQFLGNADARLSVTHALSNVLAEHTDSPLPLFDRTCDVATYTLASFFKTQFDAETSVLVGRISPGIARRYDAPPFHVQFKASKRGHAAARFDASWGQFLELYGAGASEIAAASGGYKGSIAVFEEESPPEKSIDSLVIEAERVLCAVTDAVKSGSMITYRTVRPPKTVEIRNDFLTIFDSRNYTQNIDTIKIPEQPLAGQMAREMVKRVSQ